MKPDPQAIRRYIFSELAEIERLKRTPCPNRQGWGGVILWRARNALASTQQLLDWID